MSECESAAHCIAFEYFFGLVEHTSNTSESVDVKEVKFSPRMPCFLQNDIYNVLADSSIHDTDHTTQRPGNISSIQVSADSVITYSEITK